MSDLADLTIHEASSRIAKGSLTSVKLVEATLERIAQTEPAVHAYAYVGAEQALAAAHRADATEPRGPLHGIPFAVKDVLLTSDMPTEANSRVLAGHRSSHDAWAVARLREAGAILVGKHVTHEFASGQDVPPTRNPWNLAHYPGGSSAGSGASMAVGSCLFALGTDAGGSVRKPAAVTGVVGLKPTYGRVSAKGTVRGATVPTVEHVGIFSRSVRDAAIVLNTIAGEDPADPRTWLGLSPDFCSDADVELRGVRIGLPRLDRFGPAPDESITRVVADAINTIGELGAEFVEVDLPLAELALPAATAIITGEFGPQHRQWLAQKRELYSEPVRRFIELSLLTPSADLQAAYRARRALQEELAKLFAETGIHALAMPTLPCTSMPLDEMVIARDMGRLIQYTCPWSLVGQPALSVPCGFTSQQLPVGLQLVGAPLDEKMILRMGQAFQSVSDWHERRPVLTIT